MNLTDFVIRNPQDEDVENIAKLDFVLKLLILYHGDYDKKNMFCAVNGENEIVAVAHLMRHDTFDAVGHDDEKDFVRFLTFEMAFGENGEDEAIKVALTDALIKRAREIKAQHPEKRIVMAQYMDADDLTGLSYYLTRGFTIFENIVVYKFDLNRDIPCYPLPEGVEIKPFVLDNDAALKQFNQAELASFDGVAWSLNHLRWMQGSPEMINFCAFSGNEMIGNTSTWRITEERSATENVFVTPEWRKQGIARNIICAALEHLKQQGKTIATLGTRGTNRKAIRLYTQIGYELYGFRFTVGMEIGE
ncbi:GNAT family N-acetyltransferase [Gorillibacterium massiliense]|uniref:GNAT family N-acetyltransferase n=1 Tax=Gorillibacterium massiliense TaxID=1280390 RepID=UPI0004BACCA9|nr:GNAT family N-acetyltransferase [Gorillibacterium massiliense]